MDLNGAIHMHHPQKGVYDKTMLMSDDEDPSFSAEDSVDGRFESGKGKKGSGLGTSSSSPWHRVKWTDATVKLLITAVSYAGEDVSEGCGGIKRKLAVLQKKGKWKAISKVMAERGFCVSPQQCEDKFNDLNKRYKRLTDILGRGTSCKVVENPALLNSMYHLSDKAKDDVRKILSSKQLFYEEMCSYHNGNRFHLPPDPALHRSLLAALGCREEHDMLGTLQEEGDEDGHDDDTDGEYDDEEYNMLHKDVGVSCSLKRMKEGVNNEHVALGAPNSHACERIPHPHGIAVDMNQVIPEGCNTEWPQKHPAGSRSLHLEEQRLQIQIQMLEIKQQRFEWEQMSSKKDRELDKMRMENDKMKLENERLEMELKRSARD